MVIVALAVASLCLAGLLYVYGGYLLLLRFIVHVRGRAGVPSPSMRDSSSAAKHQELPGVTAYFSAYNEEELVLSRIENLFAQDYELHRLEVIVISDGSVDRTPALVRQNIKDHPERRLRLIEFEHNRGRAAAQNTVASAATHDLLVCTDAETEFAPDFLKMIVGPFRDPTVGVAGGEMTFRDCYSEVSISYRRYRGMEYAIRACEDSLGVLVKTDGPCTAYRKSVWEDIEDYEDVDQVVVLLARKKQLRAVHVTGARCTETPNSGWRQELQARSRMTRKALLSMGKRWNWQDFVRDPAFSLALYSHRYLRYFSPVLVLGLVGSLLWASVRVGVGRYLVAVVVLLGVFVLAGRVIPVRAIRRLAGQAGSFFLANAGFGYGLVRWMLGDRTGSYKPSRTYK